MGVEPPLNGEQIAALGRIRYQPSRAEVRRTRMTKYAVYALMITTATSASFGVAQTLIIRPVFDAYSFEALFVIAVLISLIVVVTSKFFISQAPPTIEDGILALEYPIRRHDGPRTRRIRLIEIRNLEVAMEGGYEGLRLTLMDGTRFFLDRSAFGKRGVEVLESLCRAFGFSYTEQDRIAGLVGSAYQFRVARIRRKNGRVVLSPPMLRLYVGNRWGRRVRGLVPEDVRSLESVRPAYCGPSYLVTLTDWTRFLVPADDVNALGLDSLPRWRDRIVTRQSSGSLGST